MVTMRLEITPQNVCIYWGKHLAGKYVLDDLFKPYLHPINTPSGQTLSLAIPHDHKHHKGLMYGLRSEAVNFWEEVPTDMGDRPGIQRHDRLTDVVEVGQQVGFQQQITWLNADDSSAIFRELRTIHCSLTPDQQGFEWMWSTDLEALTDIDLIMSQWSARSSQGKTVNYHGLGMRLLRDFACTGGTTLLLDGIKTPASEGMGKVATTVEYRGKLDGQWPPIEAGVRIEQQGTNALFVMEQPFAYLSLGPTNLSPMGLVRGERITEQYRITVFDRPSTR